MNNPLHAIARRAPIRVTSQPYSRATSNARSAALALAVAVLLLPAPAAAQLRDLCESSSPARRQGGWILDVTYERASAPSDSLTLIVIYPRTGNLSNPGAAGIVEISDGTSTTFLVIERPPHLSCADINDNGLAGLTSVMLETREVPTGEPSAVSIIPVDGEIDEAGTEDAILLIVRGTTTIPIRGIKITLRVWDVQ